MASAMAVSQPDALLRGVGEGTALSVATELARMNLVSEESEHLQACECCGLSEECTHDYISRVRGVFCGWFVCGLCAEAVKEEKARMAHTSMEEAIRAHMNVCAQFNRVARADPLVHLAAVAEVMRQILRRSSEGGSSPKRPWRGSVASIQRSSSCITLKPSTGIS